ncbi:rRNA maturation RNase YbeY [Albibacterium bauzanense]|uniref:Endoribonuclease YbeY n=1 Tax=Albibacterium bauzanense TaxID=653929 RepID=A0A4R1M018_9SPHI|nr:rRNA maturation RNase YbeY [Albibacterium bauzanense]TCK82973.1 rRNA maturation RNase YbeY [Albibacterium bauzanense]
MKPKIHFFTEDIEFKLKNKTNLKKWIIESVEAESSFVGELNFIFCSDEYLLKINQEYLNHDTYTDIITFDNSEEDDEISGDIFISAERVTENASQLNIDPQTELHRIIIHGVLHLIGFLDKAPKDKALMTSKEDHYLNRRNF